MTTDLVSRRPSNEARDSRWSTPASRRTTCAARQRQLGLPTWDKPAAACLASRLPYGTQVTIGVLGQVERAEHGLRSLGFTALRVRHYDDLARIEVPTDDLELVVARREQVIDVVRGAGYRYVTLDLEGLRSGNLNAVLEL